jgi:hypothetical protein
MTKWPYFAAPLGVITVLFLHPFLSLNKPVNAKVLVVEGWIPEASLKYAANLFKSEHYELILTNGGKARKKWVGTVENSYADLAKKKLMGMGINENQIIAVRTANTDRSRTYSYAQSTVAWLLKNREPPEPINVLTLGPHARKSYLLFKKAANKQFEVGIISTPPVDYNPYYWYFSIYGIVFVFRNLFGYFFAVMV